MYNITIFDTNKHTLRLLYNLLKNLFPECYLHSCDSWNEFKETILKLQIDLAVISGDTVLKSAEQLIKTSKFTGKIIIYGGNKEIEITARNLKIPFIYYPFNTKKLKDEIKRTLKINGEYRYVTKGDLDKIQETIMGNYEEIKKEFNINLGYIKKDMEYLIDSFNLFKSSVERNRKRIEEIEHEKSDVKKTKISTKGKILVAVIAGVSTIVVSILSSLITVGAIK